MMDAIEGIVAVDLETSSAVDIKRGAWAYSEHESTAVLCAEFCYATEDGQRQWVSWTPEENYLPPKLIDFIVAGGLLVAHNVSFEHAIWTNILVPQFNFPVVQNEQWRDTQALASAINFPLSLDGLGSAMKLRVTKDKEGAALMREMRVATPDGRGGWMYPKSRDAKARERLALYCRIDVEVTVDAWFLMLKRRPLTMTEATLWDVDQRINRRGVYLDTKFAAKCARLVAARKETLADAVFQTTTGYLDNSTSSPALKAWLKDQGVELPKVVRKRKDGTMVATESTDKNTCKKLLENDDLPELVREVLSNRVEANKATSLAKLERVPEIVGRDGRLRNALQFCGAHTGRWTSYGLQLHNLPKNKLNDAQSAIAMLCCERGDIEALEMMFERPLEAISNLLRSVIAAAPGKEIIAADYSAIEARVIAWLAGQEDILDQFAKGTDVYTYTADGIGSSSRQLGKICVLALGYGMGVLKFHETAAQWGIHLTRKYAREVQRAWRETNVMIVRFWHDLENACREVITDGGTRRVGHLWVRKLRDCMQIRLPSGRLLRYWRPQFRRVKKEFKTVDENGAIVTTSSEMDEIQFWTPGKRGMERESTYGGKLAENVTQGIARDLLGDALPRIESVEPYEVVMHVHDSIASEVPAGTGDVHEFCKLMEYAPSWADGLPLAVEGYRDVRFRG